MSLARDGPVRGRAGCRMAAIAPGVAQDAPPGGRVWFGTSWGPRAPTGADLGICE